MLKGEAVVERDDDDNPLNVGIGIDEVAVVNDRVHCHGCRQ